MAHADIVNMSLAGPPDPLLTRLIERGAAQGTIFVGAAGRGGATSFPADLDSVLGCGCRGRQFRQCPASAGAGA